MTHAIAFFFFSFLAFHSHANRLPASRHDLVPTTPRSALYVAFFFFRFLAFALACVVCITLGQAEQAAGPSSSNRHGECDGLSSTKWQPYVRSAHRPPRTYFERVRIGLAARARRVDDAFPDREQIVRDDVGRRDARRIAPPERMQQRRCCSTVGSCDDLRRVGRPRS
jgi:hypothetical protein